jgi:ABC-type lipoprotein export system ATPase subunit
MKTANCQPVIKLTGLEKSYVTRNQKRVIYQDVCLDAKAGEITLIMGASGSGKTSLLRQIALLDSVTKGDVQYYGESVAVLGSRAKAKVRAKSLGFIFQSFALISEFSVLENCVLPLLMNGYNKVEAREKALAFIQTFIADIDSNTRPDELSGGEQQRVAIIRALIHEPGIIIADEPTGNLDDTNAQFIKDELKRMAKVLNSAVIVVSHDTSFIDYADAFYALEKGDNTDAKSSLIRYK